MTEHIPTPDEVDAMTAGEYKTFENRLRRAADRQGYRLEKSRTRDPRAADYGTYQLVDIRVGGVVYADWDALRGYGLHLCDVAEWLWSDEDEEGTA
jgi:hypothetical protein